MTRLLPPPTQLSQLARSSIINASDLITDAEILLQHERWQRSHVLGVFALEEIGKFVLCNSALGWPKENVAQFWKEFTSHRDKLIYAKGLLALLCSEVSDATVAAIEQAIKDAPNEHEQKIRGLYVDLSREGAIEPSETTKEVALRVVADAHQVLDPLLAIWADDGAETAIVDALTNYGTEFQDTLNLGLQAYKIAPKEVLRIGRDAIFGRLPAPQRPEEP